MTQNTRKDVASGAKAPSEAQPAGSKASCTPASPAAPRRGLLSRIAGSDALRALLRSPSAALALVLGLVLAGLALLAPVIAPQDPFDLGAIHISYANLAPCWTESGDPAFLLGTDDQGRDL